VARVLCKTVNLFTAPAPSRLVTAYIPADGQRCTSHRIHRLVEIVTIIG
jgi:hypothetical protein